MNFAGYRFFGTGWFKSEGAERDGLQDLPGWPVAEGMMTGGGDTSHLENVQAARR